MKKRFLTFLLLVFLCAGNIGTVSAAGEEGINEEIEASVVSPVIQSISILKENVVAPGEAEVQVELSVEGNVELSGVRMVLYAENHADKALYYWFGQEQLTGEDGRYKCVMELGENVVADTYYLAEIELFDINDNTRTYVWDKESNKLIDWAGGYETEPVEIVVVEGCTDTDFDVPVLQGLSFAGLADAGGMLEVTVTASDVSGLAKASIVFYNYDLEQYLYLNSCETTNLGNAKYKFKFKIHNYQYEDTYELDSITLTDGSAYANSITYWVDGAYLKNVDGKKVAFSSSKRYLTIQQNQPIQWSTMYTNDLYNTVSNAGNKKTIAVIGGDSDGSQWILDKRPLSAAKIRELIFILPDLLTDTEMIIDTAKLPTQLPDEIYAGFMISKFENGYFDLMFQMTVENIPFDMKFKNDEFSKLDDRTFSLMKVEADGAETVVEDVLIVNKDGYLNFSFPEGISSEEEWSHYRLRRNENPPCENEHAWMEETFVEKANMEQDGYEMHVCEACGVIEKQPISKVGKITLSATKFIYNGNVRKPTVTVKDANGKQLVVGTDYKVTYATGRKSVGRYAVTVTMMGKYSGSKKVYFTIVPKAVTNLKAIRYQYGNKVRLTWSKSTGATGYRVYVKKTTASEYIYLGCTKNLYYAKPDLYQEIAFRFKVIPYYKTSTGTTHYYSEDTAKTYLINTVLKGKKHVQVTGVKAAKNGTKVKVFWKNVNYETGYQISRSTSKTGTNIVATYKTTSGKSKVIAATKNKVYYYKVRAYRVQDGKKIFGMWSDPVKFTRK